MNPTIIINLALTVKGIRNIKRTTAKRQALHNHGVNTILTTAPTFKATMLGGKVYTNQDEFNAEVAKYRAVFTKLENK